MGETGGSVYTVKGHEKNGDHEDDNGNVDNEQEGDGRVFLSTILVVTIQLKGPITCINVRRWRVHMNVY